MAITFDRDDEAYLRWIDGHQHGFVVNAYRNLAPRYLMLHKASCGTIKGKPARGITWTDGDFVKICSNTRQDLEQWASSNTMGKLHPRGLCHPA
jgi:hypothetical protein